jgi:hypothetical protein
MDRASSSNEQISPSSLAEIVSYLMFQPVNRPDFGYRSP